MSHCTIICFERQIVVFVVVAVRMFWGAAVMVVKKVIK